MIAGPYRSGAVDTDSRAANLRTLNEAAIAVHRAGHVPVIGVNMALPMIEAAGGQAAAYDEIMMPVSLALAERCDACLRVGGPSIGADQEVRRFIATGRAVFYTFADIPVS
jgi:sorbitol-specific phosphotransferase system component IIBC